LFPALPRTQGHTLLTRIEGVDAAALTAAITKHVRPAAGYAPTPQVLSQTDKVPAAPAGATTGAKTPEELNARLRGLMNQSNVVLFMKGSPDEPRCGFSRKICGLLKDQGVEFSHFDILTDESVRQGEPRCFLFSSGVEEPKFVRLTLTGLKKLNDWPTYPQLIVKGELVGGLDIVQEMVDAGEFSEAVR
jgi:glutaredoxin-related protein